MTERLRILVPTNYLCSNIEVKKIPAANDRHVSTLPPGKLHGQVMPSGQKMLKLAMPTRRVILISRWGLVGGGSLVVASLP